MHKLFTQSRSKVAVGAAVVAFLFLATSTAGAAGQALVQFSSQIFNPAFGFGYAVAAQAGTLNSHAVVTVGPTPNTPSVMWAGGQWSGQKSGNYGPYTQYGYPTITSFRSATFMFQSGQLSKSHPGALNTGTIMASTVKTTPLATAVVGVDPCPSQPGSCYQSHFGTLGSTPDPVKKFGGTANQLRVATGVNLITSSIAGGNANGSFRLENDLNPPFKGEITNDGWVNRQNTQPAFPIPYYVTNVRLYGAAYTTGMITHMKTGPATTTTHTGSNMLTPAGESGTISIVIPYLGFAHLTCRDFFDDAGVPQTTGAPDGSCDYDGTTVANYMGVPVGIGRIGGYKEIKLTFLPEPGTTAMVGAGILALAGAARLRRRS